MFNKIKDKITLAALIVPAYAIDSTEQTINITGKGDSATKLSGITASSLISGAISLVMILVSIVFFFILVMGGLKWVTSGGDEKKVAAARAQITNGLIGMAIVFAAYAIMRLVGTVFGIDVFNLSLPSVTN
jgi:magnesium-transporting ATPase (P-type)